MSHRAPQGGHFLLTPADARGVISVVAPWNAQMVHTSSDCIMTKNRRVAAAWGEDWKCNVVLAA